MTFLPLESDPPTPQNEAMRLFSSPLVLLFFIAGPLRAEPFQDFKVCIEGLTKHSDSKIARSISLVKGSGPIPDQQFSTVVGVAPSQKDDQVLIVDQRGTALFSGKLESFVASDIWSEHCKSQSGSKCKTVPLALTIKKDEKGPGAQIQVLSDPSFIKNMNANIDFKHLSELESISANGELLVRQMQLLDEKLKREKNYPLEMSKYPELKVGLEKCQRYLDETKLRIEEIKSEKEIDQLMAKTSNSLAQENLTLLKRHFTVLISSPSIPKKATTSGTKR